MSVLLSIKPKYVKEIEEGAKIYEFRKSIFKKDTDEIWVYASAPIKQIVGRIFVDEIIEDSPNNLWKFCYTQAGINKKDFFKYVAIPSTIVLAVNAHFTCLFITTFTLFIGIPLVLISLKNIVI